MVSNKEIYASMLEIANIHQLRIEESIKKISHLFPLDANKVRNFQENDIYAVEMLTSRYSKLQDYMGTKVFDLLFKIEGYSYQSWTLIDKLNHLEKIGIIDDVHVWKKMRDPRNFITHEYPNSAEITADSLNAMYHYVPTLITIKNKIFEVIAKEITGFE